MTPADVAGINRLHRDVWWPERSPAGWQWLMDNPATREADLPVGLVIDDEAGQPAAFLGNFVQRFWQGDTVAFASSGFSIIVPPTARGASRQLIPTFVNLPGLVAAYTVNCNALSRPIYDKFGMKPWPPQTHDVKLSWVIRPFTCVAARGLRQLVARKPETADWLGERLMPRTSHLDPDRLEEGVEVVTDLSDNSPYALYWQALKAEGRFMVDRSPAMLRWRLSDPDLTQPILMIAAFSEGRIVAHAMAMMAKYSPIEPATLEILDLDGLRQGRGHIPQLVQSLIHLAGPMGAAKLRLQVVSQALLQDLGALGQRARREGGYGHCHFKMAEGFDGHQTWQPTPFDGDYSICMRPLPLAEMAKRAA